MATVVPVPVVRDDITLAAKDDITLVVLVTGGVVAEERLVLIAFVVTDPALVAKHPALVVMADPGEATMETAVFAMVTEGEGEVVAGGVDSMCIFFICPTSMRWSNVSALRFR